MILLVTHQLQIEILCAEDIPQAMICAGAARKGVAEAHREHHGVAEYLYEVLV